MTAVIPVRAPADAGMNGFGAVTIADVMLTMRPNRRSRMPPTTARTSLIGVQ